MRWRWRTSVDFIPVTSPLSYQISCQLVTRGYLGHGCSPRSRMAPHRPTLPPPAHQHPNAPAAEGPHGPPSPLSPPHHPAPPYNTPPPTLHTALPHSAPHLHSPVPTRRFSCHLKGWTPGTSQETRGGQDVLTHSWPRTPVEMAFFLSVQTVPCRPGKSKKMWMEQTGS
uniref:uncharacterized protein LOC128929935 n=1 Tax=Callithrix jacchus TaxID=9483 RepID=UPI0023DD577A|nr:uncharacterized protein LOC128929935 [Callithrix jacchus]